MTTTVTLTRKTDSLFLATVLVAHLETIGSRSEFDFLFALGDSSEGEHEVSPVIVLTLEGSHERYLQLVEGDAQATALRIAEEIKSSYWSVDGAEMDPEVIWCQYWRDPQTLARLLKVAREALTSSGWDSDFYLPFGGKVRRIRAWNNEASRNALLEKRHSILTASLATKSWQRCRVVRVLVFEGSAVEVAKQLARSLPNGIRTVGDGLSILVATGDPEEVPVVVATEDEA